MTDHAASKPIHVLWTGGWDSTFRVLDVVLTRRHPVQPWYIRDEERASTAMELETMQAIRGALRVRGPEVGALLLETAYRDRETIAPDAELDRQHKTFALGSQYGWMARMAKQEGLDGLDVGAVRGEGQLNKLIADEVIQVKTSAGPTYRLVPKPSNPNLKFLHRFAFPTLRLSKRDLRRLAEQRGFMDLMQMTWFCHTPAQGKPCGMCTPCMVAIKSGMGWRIPPLRRVRPYLRIVKARVRQRT